MGFIFRADLSQEQRQITNLANALPQVRRDGLKAIGKRWVKFQRKWFRAQAKGGGIWGPLDPDTLQEHQRLKKAGLLKGSPSRIGIVTGDLLKAVTSHVTRADKVHIYYSPKAAPYRNAFAHMRRLFPDEIPKDWLDDAARIAQDKVNRFMERTFGKK